MDTSKNAIEMALAFFDVSILQADALDRVVVPVSSWQNLTEKCYIQFQVSHRLTFRPPTRNLDD